ncbi:hypothetical protein [Rhodopirellula baltica]
MTPPGTTWPTTLRRPRHNPPR